MKGETTMTTKSTAAEPEIKGLAEVMAHEHLARAVALDVTPEGYVLLRERGTLADVVKSAGYPVFSTDTRTEAEDLMRVCGVTRAERSGAWRIPRFGGKLSDLAKARKMFAAVYVVQRGGV